MGKTLYSQAREFVKIQKIGRVTSVSVEKCTGKNWDTWVSLLTKAGATHWTHKEIVAWLKKKYRLNLWWQQGVASGFEMHLGKKIEGRDSKGEYSMTATRTMPRSQKKLWQYLNSEEGIKIWLKPLSEVVLENGAQFEIEGGIFGEVRTVKAPVRARLRWQETEWLKPSVLQIYISPRPKDKSILIFSHTQIKDARVKEELRGYWQHILDELVSVLK